jgi:transcriptional regulator with XRE-family HTH domain
VTLHIEQEELATLTGLSRRTISNFENSKLKTRESTRAAIQTALEARGIVFTNGDKPGFYIDKEKTTERPEVDPAQS